MLDSVIPVGLAEFVDLRSAATVYSVDSDSMWALGTIVRFPSFVLGGIVAVLLARAFTWRLLVMLVVVAVLATLLQQFPSRASAHWAALWALAAPFGIGLGAWVVGVKREAV